jgi:CheY-like chemotaxis protein
MDMRMPVMDGYEATRRIKSTEKGRMTPIVALTASTFEDELKRIDSLGIQGYIRKPFRENELFNTIGKILGINYIYEESIPPTPNHFNDNETLDVDISQIPNTMLLKMQNSLATADLDLFIQHVKTLEFAHPEITKILLNLAMNYDYEQLQRILQKKEKKG